ncbi:MAG TPA: glycosyltransferase WbuB [bacterium]|nr:glycosyltransferase WbuB [bacterium]
MKCLLIHQAFASHADAGGTRHAELARYCEPMGLSFDIITSPVSYLTGRRKSPNHQNLPGVRVHEAWTLRGLHRNFLTRVLCFFSFMFSSVFAALKISRTDVIMGTSPPIFQAVSSWLVSLIRNKPFVLEIRDLWPEFAVDMGVLKNPVLIFLARRLERWLYRRADHIIVNSPAYPKYLMERNVPAEKITVIPNGVDAAMFTRDAPWKLPVPEPDPGKYHVVYTGALGPANDIDTLIEAANRLKSEDDIHIWLVGDGKDRSRLQRLVSEKKLGNVTFTGAVPKTAIPAILQRIDLCVAILRNIPMFRTTYPNKVFDYMAAGKPTLLAIDGVIRDVIEAAGGGRFTTPGDSAALAAAILEFKNNPEKGIRMGKQAQAYVAKYFDRSLQADQFLALLQELEA